MISRVALMAAIEAADRFTGPVSQPFLGRLLERFDAADQHVVEQDLAQDDRLQREQLERTAEEMDRIFAARALYGETEDAAGTVVEAYLRGRGYTGTIPPTVRFMSDCLHGPSGERLPAMVCAIQGGRSGLIYAIHRTYLAGDGEGKAPVDPPRMMLGPVSGSAVRLAPAGPTLVVAEGIETGLSILGATGLPVWAALSAGNLHRLVLPSVSDTPELIVAADHDDAGLSAAREAAALWHSEGRRVRIAVPLERGSDFNDLLCSARPGEGCRT